MAVNTQFAKQSFKGLPQWAQGVIAVGILAGVGYLVYKLSKRAGQSGEIQGERKEDSSWNQEFDRLNSNPKTKATLTKAQMYAIANKIFSAMDGYGTDEEAIVSAFKEVKNNADFAGVQAAYGQRTLSSGTWNPAGNFKGTMIGALTDELSQYWKDKINAILQSKKIKYRV